MGMLWVSACVPTSSSAPPPPPAAPSTLVRGDEGLNTIAAEVCARPCDANLDAAARSAQISTSGVVHVELDPAACRVPGFGEEPHGCSAVCSGEPAQVSSLVVDMGPLGPTSRKDLCRALERDRGAPSRGSCDDVCESGMGCAWPSAPDRAALAFIGHLELQCVSLDEPNQSDGSNSISP